MFGWLITLVSFLLALCVLVRLAESHRFSDYLSELTRMWRAIGLPGRALAVMVLVLCAQSGGSKGVAPVTALFRLLFWTPGTPWQIAEPAEKTTIAAQSVSQAEADLVAVESATNNIVTLSFDWHAAQRLPWNEKQNVLAQTVLVAPTNISGVLYEDHYVAFNSSASTNPAVILIEYARRLDDGSIERESARVVTNSYPFTSVVSLQSGNYTCYWFRCAVPVAFTNAVRDWSGEALFGSPAESGRGFDLLGTLVIDDGNEVWAGATTNVVIGSQTNVFRNGIRTED